MSEGGPDKGQVLVGGFDLWREPKNAKKSIGYLPYDDPTPDELSPAEYLLFIAEIKGIGRELAVRHVQELLYAAGLEIYRDAPLSSLSPYERRLTGLLQALLGEPEFLLLDDPAAHLSHEDTRRMLRTVKELGEKHTVLVGLRSLSDLLSICDRILVIDGGTTAGVFDPRDAALKEYETAFKRLTGGNNQ